MIDPIGTLSGREVKLLEDLCLRSKLYSNLYGSRPHFSSVTPPPLRCFRSSNAISIYNVVMHNVYIYMCCETRTETLMGGRGHERKIGTRTIHYSVQLASQVEIPHAINLASLSRPDRFQSLYYTNGDCNED